MCNFMLWYAFKMDVSIACLLSLRKCIRLDLNTSGSDNIFFQIYMDAASGLSKIQIFFFTNKSVEFLPFWLTKHKEQGFYLRKTSSSSIKHLSKKVVFEKFLECTTAMMSRRRAEAQFDERSKHTQLFRPENNFFFPFFPPSSSPRNTDAQ